MASASFIPTLHQEVLLTPEAAAPTSVLHINLNSSSSSLFSSSRKRPFDEISGLDEESYSKKHLASEASIFFRNQEHNPRSILWRILNDRQLLELQSVDLVQTREHAKHESILTFHIAVSDAIVNGGVALADSSTSDELDVFVLTSANELYTISLKRDLLTKSVPPKDFDSSSCIRKHSLSSLSFHRPYKFVAVDATELLISLHDGGLLRVQRDSTAHSSAWKETFYSEGGWTGTLRGLIPLKRHQTVRYGDVELEPNAAIALAASPDGQHIWTVSLDHALTAWSTRTGKIVARRDLMGARHDPDDKKNNPQYLMPAEQGSLLSVFTAPEVAPDSMTDVISSQRYQMIIYSPRERAFKLFFAKAGTGGDDTPLLQDVLQGKKLTLPFDELLNTNLWRCTDFQCKVDSLWEKLQLWVSIQSGTTTKVLTVTLDLLDEGELIDGWQEKWRNAWTVVAEPNSRHSREAPELDADNRTMQTQKWLEFLLYPGRFARSSLETALHLYQLRRKLPPVTSKSLKASQQSLEQRLCTAITAKVSIPTIGDRLDHQTYYANIHTQWTGFYSILLDLQTKRLDFRSFALDTKNDLAWLVHADFVAPVRSHDKLERLELNEELDADEEQYDMIDLPTRENIIETEHDWDHMKFLAAVQDFADSLPRDFRQSFSDKALTRAISAKVTGDHAQAFFDDADVGQHVTDEAYQSLELALQPLDGIGGLANDTFTSLIQTAVDKGHRGSKTEFALNRYGSKLMIAAAQHFIQQDKKILLDLLALVAFINNDFEVQALDESFQADKLFSSIMSSLRDAELRDWLTRNVCLEPSGKQLILSTVFETLFIGDWDSHSPKTLTFAEKLTHWARQWAFATFSDWHGFTANVFATLLRYSMYHLASDFSRFLLDSAWTTYLRARLQLALGDYDEAANGFRNAAKGLSDHTKGDLDTAGLLSAEEHNHLGHGPEMYYLHVANLFEKVRQYASTADFAKLALSYINEARIEHDFEVVDSRKRSTQSPVDEVANARAEVRLMKLRTTWEEITSRLFNALVQTARYHEAYDALQKFKSPELQRSNLQKLIDSCVKNDMLDLVLELPFNVAASDNADAILLKLAKKAAVSGVAMRPAQQILYAFRTRRGDYRAAAEVLYEHLERLRQHDRKNHRNPDDETVLQAYLILINTLACCGQGEGWLLAEPIDGVHAADRKRKLITLENIRREYVAELDRRSDLQHGRYPVIGGDEMDVLY